jgi:hypothetical protein
MRAGSAGNPSGAIRVDGGAVLEMSAHETPKTLLNVTDFAKLHGVSLVTGYEWRKRGWLVLVGRKVDVEASNALVAKYRDPADGRAARGPKTKLPPLPPLPAAAAAPQLSPPGAVSVPLPPPTVPPTPSGRGSAVGGALLPPPDPMRGVVGGDRLRPPNVDPKTDDEVMAAALGANLSTEEARRVKENYLALKGKLEYERDSGNLVDLDTAKSILFSEARAVRDAWLNFSAKYGPMIAADLGLEADRVVLVLTGYVHKQVDSLGEPVGDFAS